MTTAAVDPARLLRAARRARTLSQRELATAAGVPVSTISAIESGARVPGLVLFARILSGAGFALEVVDVSDDQDDTSPQLRVDDAHDAVRDRRGRRFPAHLPWGGRPDYVRGPWWWGWHHIAWYDSHDPAVPAHVYRPRPRPAPSRLGRAPREHPFWN